MWLAKYLPSLGLRKPGRGGLLGAAVTAGGDPPDAHVADHARLPELLVLAETGCRIHFLGNVSGVIPTNYLPRNPAHLGNFMLAHR